MFFFLVDERYTPVKRGGPPVFFGRWARVARTVHLFFFSVGRAPGALRRYHVGAGGVAPQDDEKGEGADATPPALQSRGAAAKVAADTRCAPVL